MDGDVEYAERLYAELRGTGEALTDENGMWLHKERVKASEVVGMYVNQYDGAKMESDVVMIAYSKTGSHIYPGKKR